MQLADLGITPAQVQALVDLDRRAEEKAGKPPEPGEDSGIDAINRSDREAAIETWLEARGVTHAWEFADSISGIELSPADLESLETTFSAAQIPRLVEWIHCSYTASLLVDEIGMGAARISELVKALKSYSYLDQAPLQSVDIHQGLDDTLVILRSKLKRGVAVHREYAPDLPHIQAYGSELNQVWTNLIDNAIDALLDQEQPDGEAAIWLRTRQDGDWVVVEIEDNGPGIPSEALSRLFDPFFTTKPPGKGSGLGLNISHNIIVQKHKGKIDVESQPGKTVFTVRLLVHPGGLAGLPG
jgi:signal transduction histidine kinase